jgi:hypothetical protein
MNILVAIALLCSGGTHTVGTLSYLERTGQDVQECQQKYLVCIVNKDPYSIKRNDMSSLDTENLASCVASVKQK